MSDLLQYGGPVLWLQAALGFLGFGNPPPAASWGDLLEQAHANGLRWNLVNLFLCGLAAGATVATIIWFAIWYATQEPDMTVIDFNKVFE